MLQLNLHAFNREQEPEQSVVFFKRIRREDQMFRPLAFIVEGETAPRIRLINFVLRFEAPRLDQHSVLQL
jgi:hypothetical protein